MLYSNALSLLHIFNIRHRNNDISLFNHNISAMNVIQLYIYNFIVTNIAEFIITY